MRDLRDFCSLIASIWTASVAVWLLESRVVVACREGEVSLRNSLLQDLALEVT